MATPLFTAGGHQAVRLSESDALALQSLLEDCPDYYDMVEGTPPGPTAALSELQDRPSGASPDDAFCIGLANHAGLTGVLHAFRDYRLRHEWYLGLLLLHPQSRNARLGQAFYQSFETWATFQGATKIQLAVLDCNARAARFWERQGFLLPRCYPEMAFGQRRHIIIEYEKPVAPPSATPSE
jgi:GNAT superfamily N-acetyltransferase